MPNSTMPAPERVERWARALSLASCDTEWLWQQWTEEACAAIALADEEAAARVAAPSESAVELIRTLVDRIRWNKDHAEAEAALLRHIALAEASGAVPAGLQSANESPVSRAMISARQGLCMCGACVETRGEMQVTMHVCRTCGNKRCPKAENHRFRCSGSNAVGQTGDLEDAAAPQPHAMGSEQDGGSHGDGE